MNGGSWEITITYENIYNLFTMIKDIQFRNRSSKTSLCRIFATNLAYR